RMPIRSPVRPVGASFALGVVVSVALACSSGTHGGGDGTRSDPLVSQAKTGSVTPFGSRDEKAATATYAPDADATVAVYTARVTMFAGAYAAPAALSLQMIPSTITQTPNLAQVSPLMRFSVTDADGEAVERT